MSFSSKRFSRSSSQGSGQRSGQRSGQGSGRTTALVNTLSPILQKQNISEYDVFRGTGPMEMSWLFYLQKNSPEVCILGERHQNYHQKIHQFVFLFDAQSEMLSVDKGFWSEIEKCKTKGKRFILLPLTIKIKYRNDMVYHSNALILDLEKGIVSRFEPHGTTDKKLYNHVALDNAIKKELKISRSEFSLFDKYRSPKHTCPNIGPQIKQRLSKKYGIKTETIGGKLVLGEAEGFCSAWSLMMMHLRLLNPDTSDLKLTNYLLNKSPDQLAEMIRQYMSLIVRTAKSNIERDKSAIKKVIWEINPKEVDRIKMYIDVMDSEDLYELLELGLQGHYVDLVKIILAKMKEDFLRNLDATEKIRLILSASYDLEIAEIIFSKSKLHIPQRSPSISGRILFHLIAEFPTASLNYAKWVLEKNIADVDAIDEDGETALMKAILLKNVPKNKKWKTKFSDFIELLLQNHADVNISEHSHGLTPLMIAIIKDDVETMIQILKVAIRKVDFTVDDSKGNTTIDYVLANPLICTLWVQMNILPASKCPRR